MTDRRGSIFVDQAPENRAPPVPVPAPVSTTEIIGAHWRLGQQDMAGAKLQSEIDAYGPVVTELLKREKPGWLGLTPDPYTTAARQGMPYSTGRIWAKVQEIRRQEPGFMKDIPATNEAEFTTFVAKQELARRHAAQDVSQRQQGVGQNVLGFAADVGTGMTDPVNVGAMILTGGMSAPVEGAVRSVGGTMARTMLKEAAVNAGTEVVELPVIAQNRQSFGEKMTPGEMVQDVATAGIGGALFPVVTHGLAAGAKATGKAIADGPIGRAAAQATAPLVMSATPVGRAADVEVARKFSQAVPAEIRTPDERAALHVIDRQADVDATNPFKPTNAGMDAHADRLDSATADILTRGDPNAGAAIPKPVPRRAIVTAPIAPEPDARTVFMQHVGGAESGGNYAAQANTSRAFGKYQFVKKTWVGTYKEAVGAGGLTDAQIWAKRTDPALQERLMQRLTANNAAHLHSIGVPETPGNLYLEHFAGQNGAEHILKADPRAPIEGLLSKEAIDANPFLRGKTAGDVIDWAHRKMGGKVHDGPVLARQNFDTNEEWADAQREVDMADAAEQAARVADAQRAAEQGSAGMAPASEPAIRTEAEPKAVDLMPADEPVRAAAVVQESAPFDPKSNIKPDAVSDTVLGPIFLEPKGEPGIALEVGKGASATEHAERAVVLRDDSGAPVATMKFNLWQNADGTFNPRKIETRAEHNGGLTTFVKPEFRRQGVASALYDYARKQGLNVDEVSGRHDLTPAGAAFAKARMVRPRPFRLADHMPAREESRPHEAPIEADRNAPPFDKPTDKAPLAQIESIAHDLRIAVESEPDALFRVGDGETERPLSEILADLDAEDAAIAAVKACL